MSDSSNWRVAIRRPRPGRDVSWPTATRTVQYNSNTNKKGWTRQTAVARVAALIVVVGLCYSDKTWTNAETGRATKLRSNRFDVLLL